jgi:hypothetical protein
LRNLGLGVVAFEASNRRYPTGGWGHRWIGFEDVNSIKGGPGCWTYDVLPYIEQQEIYSSLLYGADSQPRNDAIERALTTPIPIFSCPSRRSGTYLVDSACASCGSPFALVGQRLSRLSRSDYAINVGDGERGNVSPILWPMDFPGPTTPSDLKTMVEGGSWPSVPFDWSGISYLGVGVKSNMILDGNTNVIMLGEKYVNSSCYTNGKDFGDNESYLSGFNNDNHRSTGLAWPLLADNKEMLLVGSFGSAHASMANFVFMDGSIRTICIGIDPVIFARLGNRFDGQRIPVDEL